MAEFPAMPLFTDAYLADTHPDLTIEQHGCYMLLLMAAWRRPKCDLPDDDAWFCRWLNIHGNKWRSLRVSVLERFFTRSDEGMWFQKRLRKERDFVEKTSRKRSENAAKGNRIRWNNKDITDRPAIAPTPTPTPTQEKKDTPPLEDPPSQAPTAPAEPSPPSCERVIEDHHAERSGSEDRGGSPAGRSDQTGERASGHQRGGSVNPRGTRCPWLTGADVPEPEIRFARALGLDPGEVAAAFVDYWRSAPGQRGVKLDWPATWRNWCRRERKPDRSGGSASRKSGFQLAYEAACAADEQATDRAAGASGCDDQAPYRDPRAAGPPADLLSRGSTSVRWGGSAQGDPELAGYPRLVAVLG